MLVPESPDFIPLGNKFEASGNEAEVVGYVETVVLFVAHLVESPRLLS